MSSRQPHAAVDSAISTCLTCKMRRWRGYWQRAVFLSLAACGDDAQPDRGADASTQFSFLTYNVAGLPQGISASNPEVNTPLISPLLNDYDVVVLQEDFSYHAQLFGAAEHPYRSSPDPTQRGLGDGLNLLSVLPFDTVYRESWEDCFGTLEAGSDCLTSKGFALVHIAFSGGASIDVYNLHADAGLSPEDKAARALNFQQLARAISERSAGKAVIVAGDFNERYTTEGGTLSQLLDEAELSDAWVELETGGEIPIAPVATQVQETCRDDVTDLQCERIDKILYRSSNHVRLTPAAYRVDAVKFSDAQGMPLSDHPPVSVVFEVEVAK